MNEIIKKNKHLYFFILIFIIYLFTGFRVIVSNDSVTNVQQIMAYDISSRTSHFMFHFLGVGFYIVLGKLFGLSAIVSTEIMLSFVSTLGAVALFYIAGILFKDIKIQYLSVIIYSLSSGIWRLSCQCEYLILVPSFTLISFLFYLKNKNFISGLFWGMGALTSPFAIFFAPAFLINFELNKEYFKKLLFLFSGFLVAYFAVNVFLFRETVEGEWSYGYVLSYYYKGIRFLRMFLMLLYGYFRSFNILIFAFLIGLFSIIRVNKKLFWVTILLFISHLPVAVQEARLGAYQFPVYPFVSLLAAYGISKMDIKLQFLKYPLIAIFILINFYLVFTERNFCRNLKDTYVQMNEDSSIKDSSIVFLYQAQKPVKVVYAPRLKPITVIHEKVKEGVLYMNPDFKEINYDSLFKFSEKIYLIESGVVPPDDDLKLKFLPFLDKQGIKTKGFLFRTFEPYLKTKKVTKLNNYKKLDVYCVE